ncbi:MAG: Flp pilus assembly complex ATPase component TadA, partial [Alphaproteobacteria bacterium]|nr:Flp pilus assembly complex ATPase component TadA [Alphaproteobacteria bacterium]
MTRTTSDVFSEKKPPPPPPQGEANAAAEAPAIMPDAPALPPKPAMRLGEKLIAMGIISNDQLQVALTEQRNSKKMLGGVLVEMGFVTDSVLSEILAESSGAKKFDPKTTILDVELVRRIPKDVAQRNKVIAVAYENETVQLAITDIYNVLAIDQVRRHFPRNTQIVPVFSTETEILELIDQYYDYELEIDGILREIETGIRENAKLDGKDQGYINPTVRLVNALLMDAIKGGASDLHFEPEGSFLRLRFRIDGQMVQARTFHRDYWGAMVVRIKIMSGMNIAETRQPQDGRISFTVQGREVDFRVATQPTIHGENIVMRLLDKAKSLVPLARLGSSDHNIAVLTKLLLRPDGII